MNCLYLPADQPLIAIYCRFIDAARFYKNAQSKRRDDICKFILNTNSIKLYIRNMQSEEVHHYLLGVLLPMLRCKLNELIKWCPAVSVENAAIRWLKSLIIVVAGEEDIRPVVK